MNKLLTWPWISPHTMMGVDTGSTLDSSNRRSHTQHSFLRERKEGGKRGRREGGREGRDGGRGKRERGRGGKGVSELGSGASE